MFSVHLNKIIFFSFILTINHELSWKWWWSAHVHNLNEGKLQKFWRVQLMLQWREKQKTVTYAEWLPKIVFNYMTDFLITQVIGRVWQRSETDVHLGAAQVFRKLSLFLISMSPLSLLQHSPVFCVAKRMMRATMTMKSKETIVMRPISREVQRGFLADFGGLVSVILRSLPSAAGCINSPDERARATWVDCSLIDQQQAWQSIDRHLSSKHAEHLLAAAS